MKVPLFKPWFGEGKEEILTEMGKALDTGWLCQGGPNITAFEEEFAKMQGVKHAIAVNNGSTALVAAQQALGIGSGDEVIVPNMTFVSTATSAMYLGAKPVFADINLTDYSMNVDDIEHRITDKTKAIIPVHFAGQATNMDKLMEIAKKHNLFVLEDAAHSHLCTYKGKPLGGIGDLAIFSFTPSKLMTTGEGGMITTNNDELAEQCRLYRNFYDVPKFNYPKLGFNFRMTEYAAIIGRSQLKILPEAIRRRKRVATTYNEAFADVPAIITPAVKPEANMNYQVYIIRVDLEKSSLTRDQLQEKLAEKGISTRLYYPTLHHQKVFNSTQTDQEFPNAVTYRETALGLPIYASMTEEEQTYVINLTKELLQ